MHKINVTQMFDMAGQEIHDVGYSEKMIPAGKISEMNSKGYDLMQIVSDKNTHKGWEWQKRDFDVDLEERIKLSTEE